MLSVFWLARLKADVDPENYERWVKEFDYVMARDLKSIVSYRNYRVQGGMQQSDAPCDYIEVLEITDVEQYRKEFTENMAGKAIAQEWGNYMEGASGFYGELIPPGLSRL